MLEAGDQLSGASRGTRPRPGAGPRIGILALAGGRRSLSWTRLTKLYFNASFSFGQRVNVLPVFDFTLVYNRGAAFSFLATEAGWQRWFFTALGIVAAAVITVDPGAPGTPGASALRAGAGA